MAITLKASRVNAGLTQKEVCEALNIGKNTLINYEKYRVIPNMEMGKKLADLYNTSVDNIKWSKE
jgi:DNA-binding XRE family transcriptional regulator